MLGAMEKLSDVLRTAYSQESNTAGQGLDENAGEVCLNDIFPSGLHAGSSYRHITITYSCGYITTYARRFL